MVFIHCCTFNGQHYRDNLPNCISKVGGFLIFSLKLFPFLRLRKWFVYTQKHYSWTWYWTRFFVCKKSLLWVQKLLLSRWSGCFLAEYLVAQYWWNCIWANLTLLGLRINYFSWQVPTKLRWSSKSLKIRIPSLHSVTVLIRASRNKSKGRNSECSPLKTIRAAFLFTKDMHLLLVSLQK